MKVYRDYVQADKVSWCVISVPTKEWAAKVFPDVAPEEQKQNYGMLFSKLLVLI